MWALLSNTQSSSGERNIKPHLLLEPAHGLLFADAVLVSDAASLMLLVSNAEAGSAQDLTEGRGG